MFAPHSTAAVFPIAQTNLRFMYLQWLPLSCGQEAEQLHLHSLMCPPWLITCINMLLTFIALYCFMQQELLLIFLVVTDRMAKNNINFSNTSLLLQLQKQSTDTISYTLSKHWTVKPFCYWNVTRVGKSLLSFSYTAYILTLVISFFSKNYTTTFWFLLYVH